MMDLAPDLREPAQLVRMLHELVRVDSVFGKPDDTLAILERGAAAMPSPSPEVATAIHSSYARVYYVQGQLSKAAEHSAAALSTLEPDSRVRSYHCLPANVVGRALCVSGRFGSATDLLTRGCDLAREAGDYTELSHSAGLLAVALGFIGEFDKARARIEECAQLAMRLNDPIRIVASHVYASALAEACYDWETGIRTTTKLLALAEDQQISGLYLYVGTTMAGRHQFHIGQFERARILLTNALAMSRELSIVMLLAWTHAFLGDVHFAMGRLDHAEAQYQQGLEAANARNDDYAGPLCLIGLAHLAALRGDPVAKVRGNANDALSRLAKANNVSTGATALWRYEQALALLGQREDATMLERQRVALVERLGVSHAAMWPACEPVLAAARPMDQPEAFQSTDNAPLWGSTETANLTTDMRDHNTDPVDR
jgi:tetratricopeptide (TPR) repeat protein